MSQLSELTFHSFLESHTLIQNTQVFGLGPQLQLCNVKNVEEKANEKKICNILRMQFSHTMLAYDPPTALQEGRGASNCVCVCE